MNHLDGRTGGGGGGGGGHRRCMGTQQQHNEPLHLGQYHMYLPSQFEF